MAGRVPSISESDTINMELLFFFLYSQPPSSGQLSLMDKNCLQFLISVPLQLILAVIPWVNYMSEGCVINQKHIGSDT